MLSSNMSDSSRKDAHDQDSLQPGHRGRIIRSCLECRTRKMKCSRSQPCQNCTRFSRDCRYLSDPGWPVKPVTFSKESNSHKLSNDTKVKQSNVSDRQSSRQAARPSSISRLGVAGHNTSVRHENLYASGADWRCPVSDLQVGRLPSMERLGSLRNTHLASKVSIVPLSDLFL